MTNVIGKALLRGRHPRQPQARELPDQGPAAERAPHGAPPVPRVRGGGEALGEVGGGGRSVGDAAARPPGGRAAGTGRAEQELGQLIGDLVTEDDLAEFEARAEGWHEDGDDAEHTVAEWALKRTLVHLQIKDHLASGAGGQARVNSVLRAAQDFNEDTVKLLRALARGRDESGHKADAAKKRS